MRRSRAAGHALRVGCPYASQNNLSYASPRREPVVLGLVQLERRKTSGGEDGAPSADLRNFRQNEPARCCRINDLVENESRNERPSRAVSLAACATMRPL